MQVYDALNELPEIDFMMVQSAYDGMTKMLMHNQHLLLPFLQLAG